MGRKLYSEKKCISCGEVKPYTSEYFFYRNKSRGWLSSWCKPCRKEKRKLTAERELNRQQKRRGNAPFKPKEHPSGPRYCKICKKVEMPKRKMMCDPCKIEKRRTEKRIDKALYKSRLRKAKPKWADRNKLREIYINRPEGDHVDHIIPIRGKNVCGLHTPENLQYLSAEENMKKRNHFSTTVYSVTLNSIAPIIIDEGTL